MFKTSYIFELRVWAKKPSVYIFAFFFCILPMAQMAEWAGVMTDFVAVEGIRLMANSPIRIWSLFNKFSILTLFLLPVIFGQAIHRDYRHNVHDFLYSYPLQKGSYLSAKFLSALTVVLIILLFMGLGTYIGTLLPGRDSSLIISFSLDTYLRIYGLYLMPNILLLGSFIFVIVLLSRNVYAGFVMVLLFYFLQMGISDLFLNHGVSKLHALLDPFGNKAIQYYSQNWNETEQNESLFPVHSLLIYNRIAWLLIVSVLLAITYRIFSFQKESSQLFFNLMTFVKAKEAHAPSNTVEAYDHIIAKKTVPVRVKYDYSLRHHIKACAILTQFNLSYILKNGAFISILLAGIAIVIFKQAELSPAYSEATLPVTWKMLQFPLHNFSGTINILTYLFMGMLINRGRSVRANLLTDSSSMPNWVLLFSNFLAIICMQLILLSIVMIGGVLVQSHFGYYNFNIGHYVYELFAMNFIHFIIAAFLALFIQTLIPNPYLGFFLLLVAMIGFAHTHVIGLHHNIFRYNWGPNYHYSDILGYGSSLTLYFLYKFYWLLGGMILMILSYALWIRGVPSIKDRLRQFIDRLYGRSGILLALLAVAFFGLGGFVWYEDQLIQKRWSSAETDRINEKINTTFVKCEHLPQPTIQFAQFWMDIYPNEQNFTLKGIYHLVNETEVAIDTLLILTPLGHETNYKVQEPYQILFSDTTIIKDRYAMGFGAIQLANSLSPKDSISFHFEMKNPPNTFLRKKSPVQKNMTQFVPPTIPRIGYGDIGELPMPGDSMTYLKMYETSNSDYLHFETIISTDSEQVAIAPGQLVDQWIEKERIYYHYKTAYPSPLYLSFISGAYQIETDKWEDVDLEIYHQDDHHHNLTHLADGMKAALDYSSQNFGSYPLNVARLIEYPLLYGRGGKAFQGICSVSEFAFISKVDDDPATGNYPFFLAAHEMAHQWWMHQLNPANALGAEMILESLCQYTALKCMEKEKGQEHLKAFLLNELTSYQKGVMHSVEEEPPLMYNNGVSHISYAKGALVFYVLSQELGEDKLNMAIRNFFLKFRGNRRQFARSIDLVNEIRAVASDVQQDLITELFEKPGFNNARLKNILQ